MTVSVNGVDKQGVYINGVQVKQALSDANETVSKGVYDATLLSTVDAELATVNIKNGITIFGFAGNANVVDTSSGDAVPGDIRTGKKAWVDGAEVTGDIPEVAIVAGSETVPAGIHTATTLSTIDVHLAPANIKKDVNIFGKVGTYEGEPFAFTEHYNAAMAGAEIYTPVVAGIFVMNSDGADMGPQYDYATGEWYKPEADPQWWCTPCIGDGSHFRIVSALASELLLMRAYAANMTFERYASQDIPVLSTYTPTDAGIYTHGDETFYISTWMNLQDWREIREIFATDAAFAMVMGDGSNLRYFNGHESDATKIALMRAGY